MSVGEELPGPTERLADEPGNDTTRAGQRRARAGTAVRPAGPGSATPGSATPGAVATVGGPRQGDRVIADYGFRVWIAGQRDRDVEGLLLETGGQVEDESVGPRIAADAARLRRGQMIRVTSVLVIGVGGHVPVARPRAGCAPLHVRTAGTRGRDRLRRALSDSRRSTGCRRQALRRGEPGQARATNYREHDAAGKPRERASRETPRRRSQKRATATSPWAPQRVLLGLSPTRERLNELRAIEQTSGRLKAIPRETRRQGARRGPRATRGQPRQVTERSICPLRSGA